MIALASRLMANWRGTLGSIAAVLVILLQIVQLLMASDIEGALAAKTDVLRGKTDALNVLLQSHDQHTLGNAKSIDQLQLQIAALQAEIKHLEEMEARK